MKPFSLLTEPGYRSDVWRAPEGSCWPSDWEAGRFDIKQSCGGVEADTREEWAAMTAREVVPARTGESGVAPGSHDPTARQRIGRGK